MVAVANRGSAGAPTRAIVPASACDSGVSKDSRPRSMRPATQTAVTALERLATGTGWPTVSRPIAASRTALPAMDDRQATRLLAVLGHPGPPDLLDPLDALRPRRPDGIGQKDQGQDEKAGAQRCHEPGLAQTLRHDT